MADLTITAASVVPGSDAKIQRGTSGATITAGKAVYLDSSDNKWKLADADSATAAVRDCTGIALNAASDGQPLAVQVGGSITIGATIAAGVAYYLSTTAGGICPVADLLSGDYPLLIGMGESTSSMKLAFVNPAAPLA